MGQAPPTLGMRRPARRPVFLVGGMLLLVALTLWRFYIADPPPRLVVLAGETMGTTYHVKVVVTTRADQSDERKAELATLVEQTLASVDEAMSTYRPSSELSQFNALGAEESMVLSVDTATVVALALQLARDSGGAFDPTVGPLVDRWGFGPGKALSSVPDASELAELRTRVGYVHLDFDPEARTLSKDVAGLRLDLSAVAKGFAVDKVAQALSHAGFADYMVEVGGELRVAGETEMERLWRVAIEAPNSEQRKIHEVLALDARAMATSGDYRNFVVVDGVRYAHTIDPRTARPVVHTLASVTVVEQTCARADALATALNVLGPIHGPEFAEKEGIAALFLVLDGDKLTETATLAFTALRPTD